MDVEDIFDRLEKKGVVSIFSDRISRKINKCLAALPDISQGCVGLNNEVEESACDEVRDQRLPPIRRKGHRKPCVALCA